VCPRSAGGTAWRAAALSLWPGAQILSRRRVPERVYERRSALRSKSLGFASALTIACAAALASPVQAAPAHCFDMFGAAIGPNYDTQAPNHHWIEWVHARGGSCRTLQRDEFVFHSIRPLGYPAEYLATVTPAAPPTVLYAQPPSTSVWRGDAGRAAELVTIAFAQRGRPVTMVTDTGRVIYRADGVWRIYDVVWRDGYRRQVAVHMRPDREYFAIESDDDESWSAAVSLGR